MFAYRSARRGFRPLSHSPHSSGITPFRDEGADALLRLRPYATAGAKTLDQPSVACSEDAKAMLAHSRLGEERVYLDNQLHVHACNIARYSVRVKRTLLSTHAIS
jgi:hypothetical protein